MGECYHKSVSISSMLYNMFLSLQISSPDEYWVKSRLNFNQYYNLTEIGVRSGFVQLVEKVSTSRGAATICNYYLVLLLHGVRELQGSNPWRRYFE